MKMEHHSEHFHSPSIIGRLFRKLHLDIPLLVFLGLISLLSFVILYSASGQDILTLERQFARTMLAFTLMTVLAHVNPYQFQRYSIGLYSFGIVLLVAVLVLGKVA